MGEIDAVTLAANLNDPIWRIGYVYTITNLVTGKVYVGSSVNPNRRFSEHRSRLLRGVHINPKLQSAWNKYGGEAFEFRVIYIVLDRSDLMEAEQRFINEMNVVNCGYNIAPTAGTTFGWKASPETRKRMSEAAKRRDNSVQVIAMAKATRGKKRPKYVIDAMQEGRMAAGLSPESRKKMAASAVSRSRYNQEDRREMHRLKASGMTLRKIGELFSVPHQCVHKYIQQWRRDNGLG